MYYAILLLVFTNSRKIINDMLHVKTK